MVENIKKIFDSDEEFITLSDLSRQKKYSLEYLLNSASTGKLKSFKIGDDWVTTMEWFSQYQNLVKQEIVREIDNDEDEERWVDFLSGEKFKMMFVPQMILIFIVVLIFSFSLSWLAYSPSGNYTAMAVSHITDKRQVVGNYFLVYTNKVYGSLSRPVLFVWNNSVVSTVALYSSILKASDDVVMLASVADKKIGGYKINDEIITTSIVGFVKNLKNNYQEVAGASHIRRQIYFDEWEKSIKSQ